MHNMAEALTVCHSKYEKLKRMSNQKNRQDGFNTTGNGITDANALQ